MISRLPYCYLTKPGVKTSIKTRSHRIDRRRAQREIREHLDAS